MCRNRSDSQETRQNIFKVFQQIKRMRQEEAAGSSTVDVLGAEGGVRKALALEELDRGNTSSTVSHVIEKGRNVFQVHVLHFCIADRSKRRVSAFGFAVHK